MDRLTTPFSGVSLPGRILRDPVGFSNRKGISRSGNYSLSGVVVRNAPLDLRGSYKLDFVASAG